MPSSQPKQVVIGSREKNKKSATTKKTNKATNATNATRKKDVDDGSQLRVTKADHWSLPYSSPYAISSVSSTAIAGTDPRNDPHKELVLCEEYVKHLETENQLLRHKIVQLVQHARLTEKLTAERLQGMQVGVSEMLKKKESSGKIREFLKTGAKAVLAVVAAVVVLEILGEVAEEILEEVVEEVVEDSLEDAFENVGNVNSGMDGWEPPLDELEFLNVGDDDGGLAGLAGQLFQGGQLFQSETKLFPPRRQAVRAAIIKKKKNTKKP
jgi:hypothetical protein